MACEQSIYLYNPSRIVFQGVDKHRFKVPCRNCPSCIKQIREDWFVRTWIQTNKTNNEKGFVVFPTLTYKPSAHPVYNVNKNRVERGDNKYLNQSNISYVPCFSKEDITFFLKKFRKVMERDGINDVKYIICCEFGTEEGRTHRSHYHCLLFLPDLSETQERLDRMHKKKGYEHKEHCDYTTPESVLPLIDECWTHGKVGYSEAGAFVTTSKAAKYVGKYCGKDIEYFSQPILSEYLHPSLPSDVLYERKQMLKEYLPFHRQSKSFGKELVNVILSSEDPMSVVHDGYCVDDLESQYLYQIPEYIKNKLFYTYDEEGYRSPTQFKMDYESRYFDQDVNESVKSLDKFFHFITIGPLINMNEVHENMPGYETATQQDIVYAMQYYLAGRPVKLLALYNKCIRNVWLTSTQRKAIRVAFNEGGCESLYDVLKKIYLHRISQPKSAKMIKSEKMTDFDDFFEDEEITDDMYYDEDGYFLQNAAMFNRFCRGNHLPVFKDFDLLLSYIEDFRNMKQHRFMVAYKKHYDEVQETKLLERMLKNGTM